MDFNTQCKIHPHRYRHTDPREPSFTLRDLYRKNSALVFQSHSKQTIRSHDCQNPITKDYQDTHRWDAYILAHGLNATFDTVDSLHTKPILSHDERKPDKLLFHLGNGLNPSGSEKGEFLWPRGLAVTSSGEILVADSMNHRIQMFNTLGVLIRAFGEQGYENGQFNEPNAVAVNMNGEIIVADSKNKRIQLFTRRQIYKDCFTTREEPVSVAADIYYNVIVATIAKNIEIYRRGGKLVNRFGTFSTTKEPGQLYIAVNEMSNTLVVCAGGEIKIKIFNYNGDMMSMFEPSAVLDGIACRPAGIHVLLSGQICITDSLNHTVSVYSEQGNPIRHLLGPTDGLGSVQQVATGPEGHMVVTEYSTSGLHSLKIFRYKDCECHKFRPGSSKRPDTPSVYKSRIIESPSKSESSAAPK